MKVFDIINCYNNNMIMFIFIIKYGIYIIK